MAEGGELRAFVFCVSYLVIFSALLSALPVGLQGVETDIDTLFPIDPSLTVGFADYVDWNSNSTYYTGIAGAVSYDYELDNQDWYSGSDNATGLGIARKVYFLGLFWFGQIDPVKFISPDGTDNGIDLYFTTITADAEEGAVRYDLESIFNGRAAGSLVIYWNSTAYSTATLAWAAGELYIVHGVGIDSTATNNAGALLVSLLFFQLPDTPPLVNVLLATPTWACIIYLIWFIVKEMIPFV